MGIHYDYKSTKGNKLMEKQAKREKKLAEKKAKRIAKEGPIEEEVKPKTLDTSKPITLDFLTNPDKEWIQKKKMSSNLMSRKRKSYGISQYRFALSFTRNVPYGFCFFVVGFLVGFFGRVIVFSGLGGPNSVVLSFV